MSEYLAVVTGLPSSLLQRRRANRCACVASCLFLQHIVPDVMRYFRDLAGVALSRRLSAFTLPAQVGTI